MMVVVVILVVKTVKMKYFTKSFQIVRWHRFSGEADAEDSDGDEEEEEGGESCCNKAIQSNFNNEKINLYSHVLNFLHFSL